MSTTWIVSLMLLIPVTVGCFAIGYYGTLLVLKWRGWS